MTLIELSQAIGKKVVSSEGYQYRVEKLVKGFKNTPVAVTKNGVRKVSNRLCTHYQVYCTDGTNRKLTVGGLDPNAVIGEVKKGVIYLKKNSSNLKAYVPY